MQRSYLYARLSFPSFSTSWIRWVHICNTPHLMVLRGCYMEYTFEKLTAEISNSVVPLVWKSLPTHPGKNCICKKSVLKRQPIQADAQTCACLSSSLCCHVKITLKSYIIELHVHLIAVVIAEAHCLRFIDGIFTEKQLDFFEEQIS